MEIKVLTIKENILDTNTENARRNQNRLDEHGILTVNLMSSPGAGKTSLILQTIYNLKPETRVAVIEGNIASSLDVVTIQNEIKQMKKYHGKNNNS